MGSRLNRKAWLVVVPFALIAACILGLWFFTSPVRLTLQEWITGNTPEARIKTYVRAVLRGDEEAALATWELPNEPSAALAERRQAVTRELMAADLQDDFLILRTEWWRTCCEPGVICDSRAAGGARVAVQFLNQQGLPVIYIFDVFHRYGSYWGAVVGYPTRHWALRDVYAQGQEPLFWRRVYEPEVRYLGWPPATENK